MAVGESDSRVRRGTSGACPRILRGLGRRRVRRPWVGLPVGGAGTTLRPSGFAGRTTAAASGRRAARNGKICSLDVRPGRGRSGNEKLGFPNGWNPCYLYDRIDPLSAGSSDHGWATRDMELKPGGVDAMTAAARGECGDYGKVNECVRLGPRSPAGACLVGKSSKEVVKVNRTEHGLQEQMMDASLNSCACDGMRDGSVICTGFRHMLRTGDDLYEPTDVRWQKRRSANPRVGGLKSTVFFPVTWACDFSTRDRD